MAVREHPAVTEYICDGCRLSVENVSRGRPKYWSDLHILRDAYDWSGCAVADGSVKLLLCLGCGNAATTALNAALDERRAAQRIEARSDETLQAAQPVGREPDGEAGAPNPSQDHPVNKDRGGR